MSQSLHYREALQRSGDSLELRLLGIIYSDHILNCSLCAKVCVISLDLKELSINEAYRCIRIKISINDFFLQLNFVLANDALQRCVSCCLRETCFIDLTHFKSLSRKCCDECFLESTVITLLISDSDQLHPHRVDICRASPPLK